MPPRPWIKYVTEYLLNITVYPKEKNPAEELAKLHADKQHDRHPTNFVHRICY